MSTPSPRELLDALPPGSLLPVEWVRELLRQQDSTESGARPERLLTLEEVGALVGRAVSTVRAWCNEGRIPGSFRLRGRDWRIPEPALRDYLRSQASGAAEDWGPRDAGPVDLGAWRMERKAS